MTRFLNLCFCIALVGALYGCSGGGGGGDDAETNSPGGAADSGSSGSGGSPGSGSGGYLAPGSYVSLPSCVPFEGSESAELKILFINLNGAPYFDELVEDAVYRQFKTIAPFSEYFSNLAFYRMEIDDGRDYNCVGRDGALSGNSLSCDNEKIHEAIAEQCPADDINGLIKIVFAESPNGGAAGEVIYIGADPDWTSAEKALRAQRNTVVHEVGHNFGLADLYGGAFNHDGSPEKGWPSDMSREWSNLDGPGCSKWCNGFKPASEYTLSTSAACPGFDSRSECLAFNRDEEGACSDADGDGHYDCCAWSDEERDDYFNSNCTPVWGVEDIGLNCLADTGCFYGGAYGNNSWRPVKTWDDSIMYGQHGSERFDAVSERELREALRCCASSDDGTASCADFRQRFVAFLDEHHPYKERIGSCGRGPNG